MIKILIFAVIAAISTTCRAFGSEMQICSEPVFAKEMEYRGILYGGKDPNQAIEAGKLMDAMLKKYCWKIKAAPKPDNANGEHVGDNCYQYSGTINGKRVFWGQCLE